MGTGSFNNLTGSGPLPTTPPTPSAAPAARGTQRLSPADLPAAAPPRAPGTGTQPLRDTASLARGERAQTPAALPDALPGEPGGLPAPAGPRDPRVVAAQQRAERRQQAIATLDKGVTLEALKQNPDLGRQLASLQNDPDPAVQAKLATAVKGLAAASLAKHVADGAKGMSPKQVTEAYHAELGALAEATGLGATINKVSSQAVQEVALKELDAKHPIEDLQKNPMLGTLLGTLQNHPEAGKRLQTQAEGWVQATMTKAIGGPKDQPSVDKAFGQFRQELGDLSAKTGLGKVIQAASAKGVENAALQELTAISKPGHVMGYPASAALIGTLKDSTTPGVQNRLQVAAAGWAFHAFKEATDNAHGSDGAKAAVEQYQQRMSDVMRATGLGSTIVGPAKAQLEGGQGRLQQIANEDAWYTKAWHGVRDTALGALDLAGQAVGFAGKVGAAGLDLAGEAFEGTSRLAGEAVGTVADLAGATNFATNARQTANTVGSTGHQLYHGAAQVVDHTSEAVEQLAGGHVDEAAGRMLDNVVSNTALGKADKFQDKAVGALGPILTNRLGVGDSVSLKVDAGATIPLEEFGAPNLKLDGGGQVTLKRVAALDASGKPMFDADHKPMTQLEVTMELSGSAGLNYSTNVGMQAQVSGLGYDAAIKAKATAEAEAGVAGKVSLSLRFDPDSPKDMGHLAAMLKATAATGADTAIPGLGQFLRDKGDVDLKQAMSDMGQHLEEISGEGTAYGMLNATASVKAGIFKSKPEKPTVDGGDDKPNEAAAALAAPEPAKGMGEKAKDFAVGKVEGKVLDKLNVKLLSASLGAEGKVTVGGARNFRTGDTTLSVGLAGSVQGQVGALGYGTGGKLEGNRKLNVTLGADGNVKDVAIEHTLTKEQFKAAQSTLQDILGRPVNPGFIAAMKEGDTVKVTTHLKPEMLDKIKGQLASGDPVEIARAVETIATKSLNKANFTVKGGEMSSTHFEKLDFHFGVEAAFGAEIGLRGGVELAHGRETREALPDPSPR